jgi:hypothetical protein
VNALGVRKTGRFELAATIALEDPVGGWVVVGAPEPEAEAALLAMELSAQLAEEVHVVKVERTEALASLSRANAEPVVFVVSERSSKRASRGPCPCCRIAAQRNT